MTFTRAHIASLQKKGLIRGSNVDSVKPVHKKSKYKNVKVVIDGMQFDSKKEGSRYRELKMLERSGVIVGLKCQVEYLLAQDESVGFKLSYIADFVYVLDGATVVEDCKPYDIKSRSFILTPLFKKKAKLMVKKYGIVVKVV